MKWIWKIALFSVLSSATFGMNPTEVERIHAMYEEHYETIEQHFDTLKSTHRDANDLCENNLVTVTELSRPKNGKISSQIMEGDEKNISITLDDSTRFDAPAILKCTFNSENETLFVFFLMVTSIDAQKIKYQYARVFEDEQKGRINTYTINDVINTRILLDTYGNHSEIMKEWYRGNEKLASQIGLCDGLQLPGVTTISGKIKTGDFLLLLNENQRVKLPGLVVCKFTFRNARQYELYFVAEYSDDKWYQVFDARKTVDGKQAYAFETYLVKI